MACSLTKLPPPLNERCLYDHYLKLAEQFSRPNLHELYKGRCDAVCLHKGPRAWACMVAGRGILGMYNTKLEAMHHALCAAMMFEEQKNGKLRAMRAKLSLKDAKSDEETDTDNSETDLSSQKMTEKKDFSDDLKQLIDANKPVHDSLSSQDNIHSVSSTVKKMSMGALKRLNSPSIPPSSIQNEEKKLEFSSSFNNNNLPLRKIETILEYKPKHRYFFEDSDDDDDDEEEDNDSSKLNKKSSATITHQYSTNNSDDAIVCNSNISKKRRLSVPQRYAARPDERTGKSVVEMRDPVRGRIIKIYKSTYHASVSTSITRSKIDKACQDGGGLVGEYLFRFKNVTANIDGNNENQENNTPSKVPKFSIEASLKDKVESGTVQSEKEELLQNTSKISGDCMIKKNIFLQQSKNSVYNHGLVKTSNKDRARALPLSSLKKQKHNLTVEKSIDNFDLSSLKPVRRKTRPHQRPKRIIELVELKTGNVLVCFRGTTDACRALDLKRKTITSACEKPDDIKFSTFSLRYASSCPPEGPTSAYVYGDHPEDFKKNDTESSYDIGRKFLREQGKNVEDIAAASIHGKSSSCYISIDEPNKIGEPSLCNEKVRSTTWIDEGKLEKMDISTTVDGLDATTVCLFCQEELPNVMFEPCNHCVMCKSCAEVACRYFCPLCHTPIRNRVKPKKAILIRPRIFSAYSIM